MSTCGNPKCRAKLSCGCQKRVASDGASVCSNCISSYEKDLILSKKAIPNKTVDSYPSILSVTYNPPKT